MPEISTILYIADILGTAVFAVSGGLMAARHKMDIFGFAVLGLATGVGGGTMRDLLLGLDPVFWIRDPNYLLVAAVAGAAVFFLAHALQSLTRPIIWMDAAGLSLFAVVGAGWAIRTGAPVPVTLMMGVLTGVGGGLLRDVLAGEIPLVLRREIYASAALGGAAIYALLRQVEIENGVAVVAGALTTFIIRALAIRFELSFPAYSDRRHK